MTKFSKTDYFLKKDFPKNSRIFSKLKEKYQKNPKFRQNSTLQLQEKCPTDKPDLGSFEKSQSLALLGQNEIKRMTIKIHSIEFFFAVWLSASGPILCSTVETGVNGGGSAVFQSVGPDLQLGKHGPCTTHQKLSPIQTSSGSWSRFRCRPQSPSGSGDHFPSANHPTNPKVDGTD